MTANLFQKAIEENKFLEFALGLNEFFIPDREYGGHWILGAWQKNIIPLFNNEINIEEHIIEMFNVLIDSKLVSEEEKTNILLYHLHVFYYELKEKKISSSDFLAIINYRFFSQIELTINNNRLLQNFEKNNKIDFAIELIQKNGGLK